MHQTRPIPSHPEFSVVSYPGFREYHVENFYVSRDGSGRAVRRVTGVSAFWAVIPAALAMGQVYGRCWIGFWVLVTLALLYQRLMQVIAETVLVIPRIGIQLETHRGLPGWPPFVSSRFIPLPVLRDVVINEGLRRWNVRYYLAVVKEHPVSGFSLNVAFKNVLPRLPILLEVYHGIHELLMEEAEHSRVEDENG